MFKKRFGLSWNQYEGEKGGVKADGNIDYYDVRLGNFLRGYLPLPRISVAHTGGRQLWITVKAWIQTSCRDLLCNHFQCWIRSIVNAITYDIVKFFSNLEGKFMIEILGIFSDSSLLRWAVCWIRPVINWIIQIVPIVNLHNVIWATGQMCRRVSLEYDMHDYSNYSGISLPKNLAAHTASCVVPNHVWRYPFPSGSQYFLCRR